MTVAFISYEYPPETGGGGIGSYLVQCNKWFNNKGNSAIIICGTNKSEAYWESETVYRIPSLTWEEFDEKLPEHFLDLEKKIDIIEGIDFRGCGLSLINKNLEIPIIARAHTLNYVVDLYLRNNLSFWQKIRFTLGALRKFKLSYLMNNISRPTYQREFDFLEKVEAIVSPSKKLISTYMDLGIKNEFYHLPLLFSLNSLSAPFSLCQTNTNINIIFFGRLEKRKGILNIIEAIPTILKTHQDIHFYFVGKPAASPDNKLMMDDFINLKLKNHKEYVTVLPAIPYDQVNSLIQVGDIFLQPSLFDNFPVACLEIMASGKCLIGSDSGGMSEMIENEKSGLLIKPNDTQGLINAINRLISDKSLIRKYGEQAKQRVKLFHPKKIVRQQIFLYQQIIDKFNKSKKKK
jgi:glycogen(starch) synthase